MTKRGTIIALCLTLLTSVAIAEHHEEKGAVDDKALEIVEKADAATKAVSGVSYKATATPEGAATAQMGPAEGEVVMFGLMGGIPAKFRASVKMTAQGQDVHITGGGNGDMYFIIDHTQKKAYEDMDPAVMGSLGNAFNAVNMIEFVHATPFTDELGSELEYRGETDVAGEPCHEIHVKYTNFPGFESTWFFSKNDYLPRRRIQIFQTPQGEGRVDRVLSDLKIEPEVDPATFVMKLPEGYEQVDDFAP